MTRLLRATPRAAIILLGLAGFAWLMLDPPQRAPLPPGHGQSCVIAGCPW